VRWLAIASIVLIAADGPKPLPVTAESVAAEIKSEGAGPVVRRLWDSGEFDRVLGRIASGDGRWIALSTALATGADAGAAEGLGLALARALPRNAAAVLSVLNPKRPAISPAQVCAVPFIEGTIKDVTQYRREAEAAVGRVHGALLRDRKAECMAALQQ
jgi:hypothetical protein